MKNPSTFISIGTRKSEKLSEADKVIHDQFSRYGKNAKDWMKKCVFMLPNIEKNKIWKKNGFGSIYEYAAKIAGMSRSKVDEALWILKKIEDKPELLKVVEMKGIHRVKPIANVATIETEVFWADKAMGMSQSTLRTYVRDLKIQNIHRQSSNTQSMSHPSCWVNPGNPQNNGLCEPKLFQKVENEGSFTK